MEENYEEEQLVAGANPCYRQPHPALGSAAEDEAAAAAKKAAAKAAILLRRRKMKEKRKFRKLAKKKLDAEANAAPLVP